MRFAVALAVVAVAWSGALYVHQRTIFIPNPSYDPFSTYGSAYNSSPGYDEHPTWEDPAAVLIAVGGLAVAVGIAFSGRRAHAK